MKKQIIRIDPHTPIHISLKKGDYIELQSYRPISGILIDVKKTTKDDIVLEFVNRKPDPEIADIMLKIVKDDYPY